MLLTVMSIWDLGYHSKYSDWVYDPGQDIYFLCKASNPCWVERTWRALSFGVRWPRYRLLSTLEVKNEW